jgi:hypothetical protein
MIFIECGLGLALILGLMSWHERLGRVITISSVGLMALTVAAVVSFNMRHQAQAISYVQPSPPPAIQPAPSPGTQPAPSPVIQPSPGPGIHPAPGPGIPRREAPDGEAGLLIPPSPGSRIQPTTSPAIQPTPGTGIPQPETPDQETSLVIHPTPAPVIQRNSALRVQSFPGFRRQPPEVSGVVEDHAGNDNGTILGGVTFVSGKLGRAFQFDGQGAQIDFGPTAGNVGTNDFTIDWWMNTTNPVFQAFLAKRGACSWTSSLSVQIKGPGRDPLAQIGPGCLQFGLMDGVSTGVPITTLLYTLTPLTDGRWHHLAWERQADCGGGTAIEKVYVDGHLDNSATDPMIYSVLNSTHLLLGDNVCVGVDGERAYNGAADGLHIWNRALSDLEISDLYQSGLAGKPPAASGLIHSWSAQTGSLAPGSP